MYHCTLQNNVEYHMTAVLFSLYRNHIFLLLFMLILTERGLIFIIVNST